MVKKILFVLLILFVIIQLFRPAKNVANGIQPNALVNSYSVPADVHSILQKACLDCHSNNTKYPWYYNIQPLAWWLAHHVKEGKEHWNVDEFLSYSPKKQDHKMEEVAEMIEKDKMPLSSYTWAHSNAVLTQEEKFKLVQWVTTVRNEISLKTGFKPELKEEK